MKSQVYEVVLIVSTRCESEYGAKLTVQNWLKQQQKRAGEVDMLHDVRVKEPV